LTQNELSEILGVTKNSIQKYESNDVPNIKIETLRKLCAKFDMPPRAFIFPEEFREYDLEKMTKIEKAMQIYIERYLIHLNEEGIKKVFEYTKDLYDSKNYQSEDKIQSEQKH
jgi:transcriptional regulator with XRE-family HTH domain